MKDIKKQFENSFAGYHKDAPAHLKKESAKLKALNKVKHLKVKHEESNAQTFKSQKNGARHLTFHEMGKWKK